MNKIFFSFLMLASIALTSASFATEHRDCGGDYKMPNSVPSGAKHTDVERAGVVLCKDYGQDDRVSHDRYAIILGHDKNLNIWVPQAGKIEKKHKYTTDTAVAELCEETGGLIKCSAMDIKSLPYIYAGNKQLFFLCDAKNPNISVSAISKSCLAAQKSTLPSCYKEIDDAAAVSVVELLQVAHQIKTGQLPWKSGKYTLHKRSLHGGSVVAIEIDGYYMRMFATRYDEAKAIFTAIFGHKF